MICLLADGRALTRVMGALAVTGESLRPRSPPTIINTNATHGDGRLPRRESRELLRGASLLARPLLIRDRESDQDLPISIIELVVCRLDSDLS
jgi:hypothetical protein